MTTKEVDWKYGNYLTQCLELWKDGQMLILDFLRNNEIKLFLSWSADSVPDIVFNIRALVYRIIRIVSFLEFILPSL